MTSMLKRIEMHSRPDSPTVDENHVDEVRKLERFVDEMRDLGVPLGTS